MDSSHQHVYAVNLRQNFGYPLRKPEPNSRLGEPYLKKGLQIGDVGYVDDYGEFIWLFNIGFPPPDKEKLPEEFHDRNLDHPEKPVKFAQPTAEKGLSPGTVFRTGVVLKLNESRATYEFTATSKTGAILILPDGATLSKLESEQKLEEFRQHATRYALRWCRYAKRSSLYLVTTVYRTKTWTLGSFYDGFPGGEILVDRQTHDHTVPYMWRCQFNVDHSHGPGNNYDVNQTVLIKGFKISVRWDWFPVVEQAERSEQWCTHPLTTLWPIVQARKLLAKKKVEHFPLRRLSQPLHPLDVVNRVLLDKNPSSQVAITHDNSWIEMLEKGLPHMDLMQEDRLREFIEDKYACDTDSEHNAIYLRGKFKASGGQPELACDPEQVFSSRSGEFAITSMRLEGVHVDHIHAGVCVLIQYGDTVKRTGNKPDASVIEWDDEIMLPADLPINVTVHATFQLGSTMGTREISLKHTIYTNNLPGSVHMVSFPIGESESSPSLLITLVQYPSHSGLRPHPNYDEFPDFVKETELGFKALYSHYDEPKEHHPSGAIECFQRALEQCDLGSQYRATALFNLATSKLIQQCQTNEDYPRPNTPVKLYEEALELRGSGDPDRSITLLLLAQAILRHYEDVVDEFIVRQIENILVEIHPDGSRNRQTADAIIRTCRFYQAINSGNAAKVDQLLKNMDRRTYTLPYGFCDWPHMLHKLGGALATRFQLSMNLSDLEKSVTLNKEALRFIPSGHYDRESIVACLATSLLKLVEVRGDLTDVDTSVNLAQLGEVVVEELNALSSVGVAEVSWQKLHDQIRLMSGADIAFHSIVQIHPSQLTFGIRSMLTEWERAGGTPTKCKRHLAALLSFLRGQGKTSVCELLEGVELPFREHKIKETMQVLQEDMPYFHNLITSTLNWVNDDSVKEFVTRMDDLKPDSVFSPSLLLQKLSHCRNKRLITSDTGRW